MHCRKEVSMSRYSAQQSSISENNRSRILQYLYHNGICSRAQIAKAIKLTPAAITKITAKLLAQGIIEETGDMDGDKNRRSIGLNLNCAKYHIIGVKFARSLVQIAVFDLKCNRIFLSDLPTVSEEHIPETVERIRGTLICYIGISVNPCRFQGIVCTTIEAFGNINGIGEYKKEKYGKEFIELIKKVLKK